MSSDDERVEELLVYLKAVRGFDFMAYKRSSLIRRIQKRLQAVNAGSYEAYQAHLESHPEEFGLLPEPARPCDPVPGSLHTAHVGDG